MNSPSPHLCLISRSPADTQAFAAEWVIDRFPGEVIALHGDLGAGKTCFVQGLALGLGIKDWVTSPTYSLIQEYPGTPTLIHADLYRLAGEDEAEDIAMTDYFRAPYLTVIEWSERIPALLPPDCWHVHLIHGDQPDCREIRIERGGE